MGLTAEDFPGDVMDGVREYAERMPVRIWVSCLKGREGRLVINADNEGGYNGTEVDLEDLLSWLAKNRPELLKTALAGV